VGQTYQELSEEVKSLREKGKEKDETIHNLMEKINCLTRRVVFLENELFEMQNNDS